MDDLTPARIARSLADTLRHTLRFAGRARRTEVVLYWLAALAIRLAGWPLIDRLLPAHLALPVTRMLGLALVLPGLALFVRRMHDAGRTGWWALLLVGVTVWAMWPRDAAALRTLREHPGADWISLLPALLSAVMLVMQLLPGTGGPNRYGLDPRERPAPGTLPPPERFR